MAIEITSLVPPPNSVGTVELKDGAVTATKIMAGAVDATALADSAVDLSGTKVKGLLPGTRLADGSVTPEKASRATKRDTFTANSTEVSSTETSATAASEVKTARFNIVGTTDEDGRTRRWMFFAIEAELKSSAATATAKLDIFIDGETTPRATLSSSSTSYDAIATSDVSIADLAPGNHIIRARLYTTVSGQTAYNRQFEIYMIRG